MAKPSGRWRRSSLLLMVALALLPFVVDSIFLPGFSVADGMGTTILTLTPEQVTAAVIIGIGLLGASVVAGNFFKNLNNNNNLAYSSSYHLPASSILSSYGEGGGQGHSPYRRQHGFSGQTSSALPYGIPSPSSPLFRAPQGGSFQQGASDAAPTSSLDFMTAPKADILVKNVNFPQPQLHDYKGIIPLGQQLSRVAAAAGGGHGHPGGGHGQGQSHEKPQQHPATQSGDASWAHGAPDGNGGQGSSLDGEAGNRVVFEPYLDPSPYGSRDRFATFNPDSNPEVPRTANSFVSVGDPFSLQGRGKFLDESSAKPLHTRIVEFVVGKLKQESPSSQKSTANTSFKKRAADDDESVWTITGEEAIGLVQVLVNHTDPQDCFRRLACDVATDMDQHPLTSPLVSLFLLVAEDMDSVHAGKAWWSPDTLEFLQHMLKAIEVGRRNRSGPQCERLFGCHLTASQMENVAVSDANVGLDLEMDHHDHHSIIGNHLHNSIF